MSLSIFRLRLPSHLAAILFAFGRLRTRMPLPAVLLVVTGLFGHSQANAQPFTVTYHANLATSGAVPVDSNAYSSNATVTVLGNTGNLANPGLTFGGWTTNSDGSGSFYKPNDTFSITANTTLYAKWGYTLTYDGNGADGGGPFADPLSPYVSGATVVALDNSSGGFTRTGYTFLAWNIAANGTGNQYSGGNTFQINGNTTLYAQWLFVGGGGGGPGGGGPTLNSGGASPSYTLGGLAVAIAPALTISEVSDSIASAAVTISPGSFQTGDSLNFTDAGGITGHYSAGLLALSSTTPLTVAAYQTALRTVTFSTTSSSTTSRSIDFAATNGAMGTSTPVTVTLTVSAGGGGSSTPGAPTITGITAGNGQVSVAFTVGTTGGSAITNYKYSTNNGGTFTAVSPAATTSPIVIPGLTNGTAYQVKLLAVNAVGDGTASTATSATPATTPGAPTITGITTGNGQLSVAFTAGTTGGSAITNYKYSTDNGSTFTAVSPAATTSPITITGLINGTTYQVQIRAGNAVGDGTATASTPGSPAPTVPGAPLSPTVTNISSTGATLSASVSSDGGSPITQFRLYQKLAADLAFPAIFSTSTNVSNGVYTFAVTGLTVSTQYAFQFVAVNAIGASAPSSVVTLTTPAATVPAAPSAPTSTNITATTITLGVTLNSNGGSPITAVRAEMKIGTGAFALVGNEIPVTGTGPVTITATGLTSDTSYVFQVIAKNAFGSSPASPSGTFSTFGAPTVTSVIFSDNGASLNIIGTNFNFLGGSVGPFVTNSTGSRALFGASPTDSVVDSNTVRVTLGSGCTLVPGDTVQLLVTTPNGIATFNGTIGAAANPLVPTVTLSAPSQVAFGSTVNIFAQSLANLLGRTPTFSWSVSGQKTVTSSTVSSATLTADSDGSFTVTYKVKNFLGAEGSASATFTVLKPPAPTVSITAPSSIFGSADLNLFASATSQAGGNVSYTWSVTPSAGAISGNGSQLTIPANTLTAGTTYRFDVLATDSLGQSGTAMATVTVNKTPVTINITNSGAVLSGSSYAISTTYDGKSQAVTATTSPANVGTVTISYTNTATGATLSTPPKDAGSYSFTATVADAANYDVTPATGTITITPAPLTVSTADVSKTYDGKTSASGASLVLFSGSLFGTDTLSGAKFAFADRHAGTNKTVTVSDVVVNSSSAANYKVETVPNTTSAILVRPLSTWKGGSLLRPTSWGDPDNWDALPDAENVKDVSIPSGATVIYDLPGTTSLQSIDSAGTVGISSGTLSLSSTFSTSGFEMTAGSLFCSSLTVTNSFSQTRGTISSNGAVTVTHTPATPMQIGTLSAPTVTLIASNAGITQNGPLVTEYLDVTAKPGSSVQLTNTGNQVAYFTATGGNYTLVNTAAPLEIQSLAADSASFDNTGGIVTTGPVTAPPGAVTLLSHSPIEIRGRITAGGNITLQAGNTTGANVDNVTINAPITSTRGTIQITAGDIIIVNAALSTAGGAVNLVAQSGNIQLVGNAGTFTNGGAVTYTTPDKVVDTAIGPNRLVNLSSRGRVSAAGDSTLISGFVISGSAPKRVLLRGAGPALTSFGVGGALTNPRLVLYNSAGAIIGQNDDWTATDAPTFAQVGAFGFPAGSRDAALVATLNPGAYTVQVLATAETGVALAEIYDASANPGAEIQRVVNISTRGAVTATDPLIGGFVIYGETPRTVLIRGIGPSLTQFGVSGALATPLLKIFDRNAALIAQNQAWGTPVAVNPALPPATANAIASAASSVAAFALASGSNDSAVLVTLAPGPYTAQVSGANNASGTGLIEIYEVK